MSTLTVSLPSTSAVGGVIVLQEAFGVTAHIRSLLFRLRDDGYVAVAPHLFESIGDPEIPYDEPRAAIAAAGTVERGRLLGDVDASLDLLARTGIPPERVALVGFCMGGSAALAVACHRDVGAAVTFYGGGVTSGRFGFGPLLEEVHGLRAPWLGLYGDLDESIPVSDVELLRSALSSSPHEAEIVRYPLAGHGFHCDARDSYERDSALDAWGRTTEWLRRHLRGS